MADPEKEARVQVPDPCLVLGQVWDPKGGDRKGAFVGRQSPEPGTIPTRHWILLDLQANRQYNARFADEMTGWERERPLKGTQM